MKSLSILLAIVCWLSACSPRATTQAPAKQRMPPKGFAPIEVVYKTVGGKPLSMLLFMPTVKRFDKAPVMLYIHGGGWRNGDKMAVFSRATGESVRELLQQGIAVATIDYRLVKTGGYTIYDCMVDCKDAARYLVKQAQPYGLDANRMGLWGSSAGGHLSLMTALGRDEDFLGDEALRPYHPTFRCVVAYYPLTTFIHPQVQTGGASTKNTNRFEELFGGTFEQKKQLAALASPITYLNKNNPPILLIHGDNDKTASPQNSMYMKELADKNGADVQLLMVKGAGHGFKEENITPTVTEINKAATAFIVKKLL